MLIQDAAKPATAIDGEPALKIELLGGVLDQENTRNLQARQLTRRCAISVALAATVLFCMERQHEAANLHLPQWRGLHH